MIKLYVLHHSTELGTWKGWTSMTFESYESPDLAFHIEKTLINLSQTLKPARKISNVELGLVLGPTLSIPY